MLFTGGGFMRKISSSLTILAVLVVLSGTVSAVQAQSRGVEHGKRYDRLVIRNVIVIDGKGTPARGPLDIVVEGNKIAAVRGANTRPDAYKNEKHVLDEIGR